MRNSQAKTLIVCRDSRLPDRGRQLRGKHKQRRTSELLIEAHHGIVRTVPGSKNAIGSLRQRLGTIICGYPKHSYLTMEMAGRLAMEENAKSSQE